MQTSGPDKVMLLLWSRQSDASINITTVTSIAMLFKIYDRWQMRDIDQSTTV